MRFIGINKTQKIQRHSPWEMLKAAAVICGITVVSACASQSPTAISNESRQTVAGNTVDALEDASRAFEEARTIGDAPAMVRAALRRIEVAETILSESAATLLTEKTVDMVWQARSVAADNTDMQNEIDEILAESDLGPNQHTSSFGSLFGGVGKAAGSLGTSQTATHEIAPAANWLIRIGVKSDRGAIVYVEAPPARGVTMTVVEDNETALCSDSSRHGTLICRWRPPQDGVATVRIHNAGRVPVPVLMITNQSVLPTD